MKKMPGYFPIYWEERAGRMWLEIDKFDTEFLYVDSMPAGMGSNDLGLDRGQLGGSRIVKFIRSGPKVLMLEPNYRYRADNGNPEERRVVEESFAQSVLWGFEVGAEENGRVLVDATQFYLRDAHNIPQAIQRAQPIGGGPAGGGRGGAGGGAPYRLDSTRSAFYLANTKNFPKNTEVEAILTFTGDSPNGFVREVTPSPEAVTIREHHSFVELPGPGYKTREFDPRAGYFGSEHVDDSALLSERIDKRVINRHRLAKKDPERRHERPRRAHRLLSGPRSARTHPFRPARRRPLVEPGVRSRRLPQRVPFRADARRRRPHGRPLQRRPVGASRHARMVVWRQHHRPAHRRNHQGPGDARFAARAAGLHDHGRPALALRGRKTGLARDGARRADAPAPTRGA